MEMEKHNSTVDDAFAKERSHVLLCCSVAKCFASVDINVVLEAVDVGGFRACSC